MCLSASSSTASSCPQRSVELHTTRSEFSKLWKDRDVPITQNSIAWVTFFKGDIVKAQIEEMGKVIGDMGKD